MSEQNKPNNAVDSAQSELDLEFEQIEPIVPKKPVTAAPSLLDKMKGVLGELGRKEPASFTSPEVNGNETLEQVTQDNGELQSAENITQEDLHNQVTENGKSVTQYLNKPEHWAILRFVPEKYRRIFIVLFLVIVILLIISWLKPSTETVNSFEQPTNRIPTQFQLLNQEQPVENSVVETVIENNTRTRNSVIHIEDSKGEGQSTHLSSKMDKEQERQSPVGQSVSVEKRAINNISPVNYTEMTELDTLVQKLDLGSKPTELPQNQPSKAVTNNTKISESKSVAPTQKAPVVEAKPVTKSKTALSTSITKTLTIPQGVSLMQVFRDNNLNISDVNAMTKASGAGGALSRFKPGDKVQVLLSSQGRVEQLRLPNGSTFIRQANGTYQYKK